jgi:pSer/pThr/pTyr-binding forkhead associated (FHA) protein
MVEVKDWKMAKLILSMDGLVLKELPLAKERTTIGRKPHNDIQIDNLAISGEHAVIVTILNDSFLEDLNSTNGTYVNGQPIKKHFLQNNDVVELGKYRLKYINDTPAQAPAPDFEKTMVLRPDMMRKPPAEAPTAPPVVPMRSATETQAGFRAGASVPAGTSMGGGMPPPAPIAPPQPAASAAPPNQIGAIQILNGANAGRELELTKTLTTLGKPGLQVAVITRRPQGYFITHVEGANFPVVNGSQLDAQAHPLSDHDVIEIAGVKMEFFIKR